jgi:hypothetical protein
LAREIAEKELSTYQQPATAERATASSFARAIEAASSPDAVPISIMPTPLFIRGLNAHPISRPAREPVKPASQKFRLQCTVQCDHSQLMQRNAPCERLTTNKPGTKLPFPSSQMSESRELFPGRAREPVRSNKKTQAAGVGNQDLQAELRVDAQQRRRRCCRDL